MPVDFLTAEQKIRYGKFSNPPDEEQLARYFHLDKTDLELVSQCRGNQNKLGFALQLTCLRFLGTFLVNFEAIPTNVLEFLAAQLGIESTDVFVATRQFWVADLERAFA